MDLKTNEILIVSIVLLLGFLGYGGYKYYELEKGFEDFKNRAQQVEEDRLEKISDLEQKLSMTEERNRNILDALRLEERKNESFEETIEEIEKTVGSLEKLSKTDPELLGKYSKVYFLNEHYTPPSLDDIDDEYTYNDRDLEINSKVWPYLENLLEDANDDGISLEVISAYRSFGEQAEIKSDYEVIYGEGANQFSADQGYSEHQLGTTVDFTTPSLGVNFEQFGNTEAFRWLEENAHRHGFVLSYPENNQYYIYEPWHWRFVGVELARDLDRQNKYFYDLGQREINEYLINIFD